MPRWYVATLAFLSCILRFSISISRAALALDVFRAASVLAIVCAIVEFQCTVVAWKSWKCRERFIFMMIEGFYFSRASITLCHYSKLIVQLTRN